MKKLFIAATLFSVLGLSAQEHFSGINTSQRTGILNAGINPAELANLGTAYDVNIFSVSIKGSSNKIGFSDLVNGSDLEQLLFKGKEPANLSFDGEIFGPSVAYRSDKWGFALFSKANAKLDIVDVDDELGNALTESIENSFYTGSSTISNNNNQRLSGTSWGEIGLSAARNLYEDGNHKFNAGVTLKLLFPGSYANFGADRFTGTINNDFGDVSLTNTVANLNIAYSGNLGNNFSRFGDYAKSLYGKLNGAAVDFGVNYQLKDTDGEHYKLNLGLAVRNLGGMTFKSRNNSSTDYVLRIQGTDTLNLNQFQNTESLADIERQLLASGFLDKTSNDQKNFKVKLPAIFSGYADVKVVPTFYVTVFTQLRMKGNDENDQITSQNIVSLTPRYTLKNYEVYLPFSHSELSGIAGGIGFRAYGFYIGSGSILTALIGNSKQADAYLGYNFKLP